MANPTSLTEPLPYPASRAVALAAATRARIEAANPGDRFGIDVRWPFARFKRTTGQAWIRHF